MNKWIPVVCILVLIFIIGYTYFIGTAVKDTLEDKRQNNNLQEQIKKLKEFA